MRCFTNDGSSACSKPDLSFLLNALLVVSILHGDRLINGLEERWPCPMSMGFLYVRPVYVRAIENMAHDPGMTGGSFKMVYVPAPGPCLLQKSQLRVRTNNCSSISNRIYFQVDIAMERLVHSVPRSSQRAR